MDAPTQLDAIVSGWKSHFWSADHEIEWRHIERPTTAWLSDNTLLVGIIDALGYNSDKKLFFGEWKTANPREKNTWKQVWRMNPQSLSYGVLVQRDPDIAPDCSTFTVRKAFKERVTPTFDHAWYTYSPAEVRHWEGEILRIADEIRAYRASGREPWPTNFKNCFQYGVNYACSFYEEGCSKQNWAFVPANSIAKVEQPFVQQALDMVPFKRDLVILSPSRIEKWLSCREAYRKTTESRIVLPGGPALEMGKGFHSAITDHYRSLMAAQAVQRGELP